MAAFKRSIAVNRPTVSTRFRRNDSRAGERRCAEVMLRLGITPEPCVGACDGVGGHHVGMAAGGVVYTIRVM